MNPMLAYRSWRKTSHRPGILVVDDDIHERTLLTAVLWRNGFTVWLAGNGPQAVEVYSVLHAEIDMVLLAVRMPDLDGPHTLAALQKFQPDVRCCFLIADSGHYTDEALLERGALALFRKPLSLPYVMYQLRNLLHSHQPN
jgi:CheY-like chemotaxis protein